MSWLYTNQLSRKKHPNSKYEINIVGKLSAHIYAISDHQYYRGNKRIEWNYLCFDQVPVKNL